MFQRRHRVDVFWLVAGLVILFVGGYYLLRNTFGFDLAELDGEMLWPILVIGLGVSIVASVVRQSGEQPPKA